jgi:hypothetical protein
MRGGLVGILYRLKTENKTGHFDKKLEGACWLTIGVSVLWTLTCEKRPPPGFAEFRNWQHGSL